VYYVNNAFSNIICCRRYPNGNTTRISLSLSGWHLVDLLLGNVAFEYRFKENMACTGLYGIFLIVRWSLDGAIGLVTGMSWTAKWSVLESQ
jgi:hypothetical protein